MADPVTLSIIAVSVAAAGAVTSAIGTMSVAKQQSNQLKAQAEITDQNIKIAQSQGDEDARRIRLEGLQRKSAARVGYASSGIALEGSSLAVISDMDATTELDALTSKYQTNLKARGYSAESSLLRTQATGAMTQGYIGAGASLLSGASMVADMSGGGGGGGAATATPSYMTGTNIFG